MEEAGYWRRQGNSLRHSIGGIDINQAQRMEVKSAAGIIVIKIFLKDATKRKIVVAGDPAADGRFIRSDMGKFTLVHNGVYKGWRIWRYYCGHAGFSLSSGNALRNRWRN